MFAQNAIITLYRPKHKHVQYSASQLAEVLTKTLFLLDSVPGNITIIEIFQLKDLLIRMPLLLVSSPRTPSTTVYQKKKNTIELFISSAYF